MRVFVDSNIIIESFKKPFNNKAVTLMEIVLKGYMEGYIQACINLVVENEVIYLLIFKKKSGLEFKGLVKFLDGFTFLEINQDIRYLCRGFIEEYNLKPNDSLILATCKHYGIPYLISLDEDFKTACEREGIVLIDDADKLKEVFK